MAITHEHFIRPRWLLFFAAFALCITSSFAQEKANKEMDVWGAVIYATNGALKQGYKEVDSDLKKQLSKIATGYSKFQLLGGRTEPLLREYESWVVPTKEFFFNIDYKGKTANGHTMIDLQVWHEKKVLVKTDANVKPNHPIVIQGPKWGEGQLIFVIDLK